jgi:hypothetical protein
MVKADIPETRYSSDNDWGVPMLMERLHADCLDLPLLQWGTRCRKARMNGTWAFYVDDYRFSALWRDPSPVIRSGCINVIEPNFSIYEYSQPAEALYQIYRKRHLARTWQELAGIKVFVDMNVPLQYAEMNLLGVPRGWRSYATRGYTDRLEILEEEYALAQRHADTSDLLFVVYGGGKLVRDWATQRAVNWYPEQESEKRNG